MKNAFLTFLAFCFVFAVSAQVERTKPTTATQKSAVEQSKIAKEKMEKERSVKAQQTNQQIENPNAPVIVFDKKVHDYGTLAKGDDGNCTFKFTNEGKEPLILSNVRASWGCTIPAWPRQPVLPGESEEIVVRYNTKKVGTINKSITVYSNAKQSPIVLRIKGKVEAAPASVFPEKKLDNSGSPVEKK